MKITEIFFTLTFKININREINLKVYKCVYNFVAVSREVLQRSSHTSRGKVKCPWKNNSVNINRKC